MNTLAERLLDLAHCTRMDRNTLIVATESCPDHLFARIKLAMDFERKGPATVLQAIVEGWDQQRIVRETY